MKPCTTPSGRHAFGHDGKCVTCGEPAPHVPEFLRRKPASIRERDLEAELAAQRERLTHMEANWALKNKHIDQLDVELRHTKACYERAIETLTGIHMLLSPGPVTTNDGRTFAFNPPPDLLLETWRELSARIRDISNQIAQIETATIRAQVAPGRWEDVPRRSEANK